MNNDDDCPCGSGSPYASCCRRFIEDGAHAASAETLMRSRYTAYAMGNNDYLLDSWHPTTRPASLDLDPAQRWLRLRIVRAGEDSVEFIAICKINGKAHRMHELSRFTHEDGRWYYTDGTMLEN